MISERPSQQLTRMRSTIDIPADDQEFLDWAFDQADQRFEEGLSVCADDLLHGRESLRAQIEDLVLTARQVAIGAPSAQPAPKIGGFTILNEIGHGGMGTVFLARQEALGGRLVALKVLPWTFAAAARSLDRFRNEANAIARLRHPNIVAVHDIVHDGETHAFAMEWVDGSSLARLIDHLQELTATVTTTHLDDARIASVKAHLNAPHNALQEVSWPAYIIRVGIAIARALETVHQAGLLHRDVKPANVLIRRDGTPLLSDFGLVRETDATVTNVGSFAGTAAYAAPEQLRGDATGVDRRADVYSLGVTPYHALTLRLPFTGHSATNLLRQIEGGAAPPLRKVNRRLPVDLQTIIAKAMEPEPARRYQTADDLADDLQRVLNLQPIKARPAGMVTRTLKLLRRNRRALIGACVGGGLALGLGVLLTLWLIFFPRWAEAHLRNARLALLDQSQSNSIFNVEFFGLSDQEMVEGGHRVSASADSLRLALDSYNAALRLKPFDRVIRQERDIVSASLQSSGIPMPGLSPEDDRSRGLAAFLHGEIDASLQAWSKYESSRGTLTEPDPFIEAATGVMYLVRGEAPRAYPRLREACRAFPDFGSLMLMLTDAAVQCGDLEQAGELLIRAGEPSSEDLLRGFERVRANLLAAQGRDDEAEAAYISAMRTNTVARFNYGGFLESRGRIDEAIAQYQRIITGVPNGVRPRRALIGTMDRWWAVLDVLQRAKLMASTLDFPRSDRMDFLSLLHTYEQSVRVLEDSGQRAGPSSAPSKTADSSSPSEVSRVQRTSISDTAGVPTHNTGPRTARLAEKNSLSAPHSPADASAILQRVSLWELAQRMEITNMDRWNRIVKYPRVLKVLQSLAWLSAKPRAASRCIERLAVMLAVSAASLATANPACFAGTPCATPPCFQGLGDLPGGDVISTASALSTDGTTVAGSRSSAASVPFAEAFRWRASEGMIGLGSVPGTEFFSTARAVSGDGEKVVGQSWSDANPHSWSDGILTYRTQPSVWTSTTGMLGLGMLPNEDTDWYCTGISDDGLIIVGGQQGWYKVGANPMTAVALPGAGQFEYRNVYNVTPNGSHALGAAMPNSGVHNAAIWEIGGGHTMLGFLPGGSRSVPNAGTFNVSIVVGYGTSTNTPSPNTYEAFRWTFQAGMIALSDFAGGPFSSSANKISGDGSVIVGFGTSAAGQDAALWDQSLTIHRLIDVLAAANVTVPPGWILTDANGITINGETITIVGNASNPDGDPEAWIARYSIDTGCFGDVTNSNSVDIDDLLGVINSWGACVQACCLPDITGISGPDGNVDIDDLLGVINSWGACK